MGLEMFHRSKRHSMGRAPRCKECAKRIALEWAAKNPERAKERSDKWRQAHRERYNARIRAWKNANQDRVKQHTAREREKDRHKIAARAAVFQAIRSGNLARPGACATCGARCTPHAHHVDYARPLDVEWLCVPCHSRRHST